MTLMLSSNRVKKISISRQYNCRMLYGHCHHHFIGGTSYALFAKINHAVPQRLNQSSCRFGEILVEQKIHATAS